MHLCSASWDGEGEDEGGRMVCETSALCCASVAAHTPWRFLCQGVSLCIGNVLLKLTGCTLVLCPLSRLWAAIIYQTGSGSWWHKCR